MILLLFILSTFQLISTLEMTPEKLEMDYRENDCFKNITYTLKRYRRNGPYYLTFDYIATRGYGNNITLKWIMNEYLSGRYVEIPIRFEYRLCDFLYKDIYFGQMYAKQLQGNWSCPFPPGRSIFRNLVMHIENLPLIPFTYSSLIVRTRADLTISMGPPYREIAILRIYSKVTQKLKKSTKKGK